MVTPRLAFFPLIALLTLVSGRAWATTDYYSTGPGQGAPDGMCDVWQQLYNAWGMDPNADDDHDGCSNLLESIAGTDPRNPNDCTKVGNVVISGSNLVLTFASQAGKQYQVLSSSAPGGPVWTPVAGSLKVASTSTAVDFISIPKPAGATLMYYKLETRDVDSDSDGVSDWAERKLGTDPTLATSSSNASGGVANDADTLHSLLSMTLTTGNASALEKEGTPASLLLTRTFGTMPLTVSVAGSPGATDPTKSSAMPGAYLLKNPTTNATVSSVSIPANQGTPGNPYAVVNVAAVANAVNEVPRALKVTLRPANLPATAAGPSATVMLRDADPTNTANQQLYVAYLGREAGVTSTATGIATALVSGDNDGASVSLTFSNLSSIQNNAYIRIGNDNDVLRLPLGQVSGAAWGIRAAQTQITDQAMLDALRAGQLYVTVSSANYTSKEIFGYFNKASGSTTFDPNRADLVAPVIGSTDWPTPASEALDRDIYRLLGQCTFGPTTALHDEVLAAVNAAGGDVIAGYTNWLNTQMDSAQTPSVDFTMLTMACDNEEFTLRGNKPVNYSNDPQYASIAYSVSYDSNGVPTISNTANTSQINNNYPNGAPNRRYAWWTMVTQGKDQVRQRMAQALSEILVISDIDQTVNDRHYGCAKFWDTLAAGAFGKYRTLLEQVSYNPMMGIYLSSITNRAAYNAGGGLIVSPDENYAREVMQLFSVGLVLRNPDGSLVLDANGLPIPTYDQTDITEMARVMTGWSHGARHMNASVPQWNGTAFVNSVQRTSPSIEFNGTTSTWFGRDDGHRFFQAPWMYPMKLIGRIGSTVYHDFGTKNLFAGKVGAVTIPAQTLPATGSAGDTTSHAMAVADMTLAHNALAGDPSSNSGYNGHPNTPVNISRWLIQRLVTSNPSAGYIYRVSSKYTSTNGNLGEVVKAILLDYEARSLPLADSSIAQGKVKEPLIAFTGLLRALKAFSGAPVAILRDNPPAFSATDSQLPTAYPGSEVSKFVDFAPPSLPAGWGSGPFRFRIGDTTSNFGQGPQHAPSVFNWFLPDYVVPGPMAQAGLVAPEMQIATESNEVARINWNGSYAVSNLVGMSTTPGSTTNVQDFILSNSYATPVARFANASDVSTNTFTFSATNWNVPQTVRIYANNNSLVSTGFTGNITYTLGGTTQTYSGVSVLPTPLTVIDNDPVNEGLVILQSGGTTWVQEGGKTDSFTVMLSAPPMVGIPVTVNLTTGTQITLSAPALTFDSTNWNVPQTVTVAAVDDAVSEAPGTGNDAIQFSTTSAASNYNGVTAPAVPVNVVDNDDGASSFGVLISEASGPIAVTESSDTTGTASYTIVLTKQPSASVTVTATPDAQLNLNTTLGGTTFGAAGVAVTRVFTTANWNVPQAVVVRGNQDTTQEGDHTGNILHSIASTAGGYTAGMALQPLAVKIADDDNRIMLAHVGGGETRVAEDGSLTDTITVALRVAPTAGNIVVVSLASSQVTCSPATLTFTTANYSTPQIVTVTAIDDFLNEGLHTSTITAYSTSGDSGYNNYGSSNNGLGASLPVSIIDNDRSKVIVTESGGSTIVGEDGTTDTYTLVLSQAPLASVTVTVTPGSQVTVAAPGGQLSSTPTSVVFDSSNWNIPQTITVGALQDTNAEAYGPSSIIHSVTSADKAYGGTSVVLVNPLVIDNDLPLNFTQSNGITTVAEGGTVGTNGTPNKSDTFTIALAKSPTAPVTVTLNADPQITVSPSTLTFTSQTSQTVTVTAVDDAVPETTPHTGAIYFNIASTDSYYNGATSPPLFVAVTDNDSPGVSIVESNGTTTSTESATGSSTDSYTVVLTKVPSANVTVVVDCGTVNQQMEVLVTGSTYASTKTLTFTTANWNTAQTVTVRAKDDTVAELRHLGTINHTIGSGSAVEYTGLTIAPVVAIITDNDNAVAANKVQITESSGSTLVSEAGLADTYTVVLSQAPTDNVTVTLSPDSQLTVSPATLTFTPTNFATAQTVTVRAIDDHVIGISPRFGYIAHTAASADPVYNNIAIATITAGITDNDGPSVVFTQSGGTTVVAEGGATDTYTIVLSQPPTANVSVSIGTNAQLTFSPAGPFVFDSNNWNVPQTVTVTAVDDTAVQNTRTVYIAHTVSSADPRYNNISAQSIPATVIDNDGPKVTVTQSGGDTTVTEGGSYDTITLVLTQPPAAGTTLDVNLVAPSVIIPVPRYGKQVGYFTADLSSTNQQKDNIVMDYTEVILLYRTTFYNSLTTQYGGTIPVTPGSVQLQNAHWAATKAIINLMDLWWAGGSLKAGYPDSVLVEPNTTPPSPLPAANARQAVLEAIYYYSGGTGVPSTTRYTAQGTYDPKNPPTDTMNTDIRDRARYAAYLMTSLVPGMVSH